MNKTADLRRLVRVRMDAYLIRAMMTTGNDVRLVCVEGLPSDAEWIGEYFDQESLCVYFIFRHPSFVETPPNETLPILHVSHEATEISRSHSKEWQISTFTLVNNLVNDADQASASLGNEGETNGKEE